MSTQTDLFCRISLFGATYNSLDKVEIGIREASEAIKEAKNEIRDLVMMTEPQKMLSVDSGDNVYDTIVERLNQCFETIIESNDELFKLEYLKANWDACHDKDTGFAIPLPECIDYDAAFLEGDRYASDARSLCKGWCVTLAT